MSPQLTCLCLTYRRFEEQLTDFFCRQRLEVKKALGEIDGISNVKVDLASKTATYEEEKPVSAETVRKAISAIGFEVA